MRPSVPHLSFLCRSLMSMWSSADTTSSHCKHSWSSCPIGKHKSMAKPSQTSPTYSTNTQSCTPYISSSTIAFFQNSDVSKLVHDVQLYTIHLQTMPDTYQHTQSSFSEWVCTHVSYATQWIVVVVRCSPPNLIYSTQNKTPTNTLKQSKRSTPKNVCRTIRHESTRTMNAFAYCCYQMDPNNFCCSSQALAGEVVCGTPGEQLKEEIVRCQRV